MNAPTLEGVHMKNNKGKHYLRNMKVHLWMKYRGGTNLRIVLLIYYRNDAQNTNRNVNAKKLERGHKDFDNIYKVDTDRRI